MADPATSTVRTAYEGRRIRVEQRRFVLAGREHTYDIVIHPGAAVILPILDDGRIVLIANYRLAVDHELLELPAGTLDPGEDPADCAARELAEETGYRAGRIVPLLNFYSTPGVMTEMMYTFLATGLTPGDTAHDATEQIRLATIEYSEALAAIHAGRIVDGKTITTLLYYDRFIRNEGRGS